MKIVIGYPPLKNPKGYPFIGQNRQFQWGATPWTAYPMVPAMAATLLKQAGHEVYWLDGIWEKWSDEKWEEELWKINPDVLAIETKTPVVKLHWKLINKLITDHQSLTTDNRSLITVLFGDHVTALPEESMENSKVDYILTGGDYDFLLLNLVEHLTNSKVQLEPGIWYREEPRSKDPKIQRSQLHNTRYVIHNTGQFKLNHKLSTLPPINRDLTKWKLYAYENSNYWRLPGSYTMFGRDCWWGKCSFCVTGDTKIVTNDGLIPIEDIVNHKKQCTILTANSGYKKVTDWHKRLVNEEIVKIKTLYLNDELKITSNHKVYCLPKASLKRCTRKYGWTYECRPSRESVFIKCKPCPKKYYEHYKIEEVETNKLEKGDFLTIPIDRTIKDVRQINIKEIIYREPTIFNTHKKISEETIDSIIAQRNLGKSERTISRLLKIDRETVHRYLLLADDGSINMSQNHFTTNVNDDVSFFGGHHKIPQNISIDNDALLVMGLYLAEGHVSYHRNRPNSATIGFTYNIKESELINKTKEYFKNNLNITLGETINNKNHTCQLYVSATLLCKVFKTLFGENCYEKRIPKEFLYLPLDRQRNLLRGLFLGDGHLRKMDGRKAGVEYIYETVSKTLAIQIFQMLLRFNVLPSYKTIPSMLKNKATKYKITLFRKDIPFVFPDILCEDNSVIKYKRGFILADFALVPITKIIKENFQGYVFNLTVEEDHSYTANFLSIKNCSWTTLFPGACFRSTSVENALDEVGLLIDNYGIKEIMDDSGSFPVGNWMTEFCEGMIDRGYNKKIRLSCNMRFNAGLTREDYLLMGKAGFRFILYGLESVNQKTLDKINKNSTVEIIEPTLRWAKEAGLNPHLTAMVGYPWETKQDAVNTLEFAKKMFQKGLADTLQATIVIPYPGTPLFAQAKKEGWLKTEDWTRYDMREPILKTEMSDEEIKGLVQGFFVKSVFNPQFFFRKLKEGLTSWENFQYYIRFGLKFISKMMDFKK